MVTEKEFRDMWNKAGCEIKTVKCDGVIIHSDEYIYVSNAEGYNYIKEAVNLYSNGTLIAYVEAEKIKGVD